MSVFDSFRIDGKTALVTGGSKGLGHEMALALAEAGANVALCSRSLEEAQSAAEEIGNKTGRPVHGYCADVVVRESIFGLVSQIGTDLGPIDILINPSCYLVAYVIKVRLLDA